MIVCGRYNIIFYWSKCCMLAENGDLEAARQMLVEELDTLSAMRGWTVTVSVHRSGSRGDNVVSLRENEGSAFVWRVAVVLNRHGKH